MSNMTENSKNEIIINSQQKISKNKSIDTDNLNEEQLNNPKKYIEKKEILLNTVVDITVELGKSKIKIKDFFRFSKGSMLVLDKTVKEPLDIFINGYLIASGEIVVMEKKYGLRITNIKNSFKNIDFLS